MLIKLRRICKFKFAAKKELCVGDRLYLKLTSRMCCHEIGKRSMVDTLLIAAYYYLHTNLAKRLYDETWPQAQTAPTARRFESPSRARTRAAVPVRRFLRRPRSGSDQIRDAAPLPCRRGLEGRGGYPVRYVAPDALPGRSGVCARGCSRFVAQTTRSQRSPQAQYTGHGLHREAPPRRWLDACACPGAGDRIGTRALSSSTQHRTRARAQKKTVAETALERLPQAAAVAYERLRADVLRGQGRPDGVAALRFHGMVQGLALLLKSAAPPAAPTPKRDLAQPAQRDSEFVRVLANIVLRTHSELTHVY